MTDFSTSAFYAARDAFSLSKGAAIREWQQQADRAQASGFEIKSPTSKVQDSILYKDGQPVYPKDDAPVAVQPPVAEEAKTAAADVAPDGEAKVTQNVKIMGDPQPLRRGPGRPRKDRF